MSTDQFNVAVNVVYLVQHPTTPTIVIGFTCNLGMHINNKFAYYALCARLNQHLPIYISQIPDLPLYLIRGKCLPTNSIIALVYKINVHAVTKRFVWGVQTLKDQSTGQQYHILMYTGVGPAGAG